MSLRPAAASAEILGNSFSHSFISKLMREEGALLEQELFGSSAELKAYQESPPNPAELMVVGGDGARYRTNEADLPRKNAAKPAEDLMEPAQATKEQNSPAEPAEQTKVEADQTQSSTASDSSTEKKAQSDKGWRENKVGVIARAMRGSYDAEGSYKPPLELVKTYVATTGDIHKLGRELRIEADRRGVSQCPEVVWISDHGHGLPGMRQREFPEANVVTDIEHVRNRLKECAEIIKGEGPANEKERQSFGQELRDLLWEGQVGVLIARLIRAAEPLAGRPERPSQINSQPARTLWEHIFYLEAHQETMDYPTYRARGWPLGSGTQESACGQFGDRFKHARMRWTRLTADGGHHILAAVLCKDNRWKRRWPPPIRVLEQEAA